MKYPSISFMVLIITLLLNSCDKRKLQKTNFDMSGTMIRIAEIEIYPAYIEEYKAILKEESEASVRLEPGVISIYPMYQRNNPAQIRLLEIYVSKQAYESHLKTPHFQKYKTTTLKMVKSLELIDMEPIDAVTMPQIFCKIQ